MPQLNPAPWLAILVLTWLVFLTIIPKKILTHSYPNDPSPMKNTTDRKMDSWAWAWY